ncbi:agmatinase [Alicyclobacillus hesperidum URH17-3-68]|uniref:Agmatinase n=1 Tax=Alicyclobacillus hesperidum TaxID=89784 RepID=A0A1H2VSL7_9BACL|nr:agmatinase [Alicyclobacillus hesperidum]EJY56657.1 agmatinase [Alicyclobacillus hesperidum URH17-3-68]GLG01981.1 agmatinase [Alicyclobacillus hesperidum subsp. aegles]GLV14246.1 agmatinase [Alicyclobacillus hesperidum]SDW71335.1 agmatinase [Alicyclobacillus hesperidum]
MSFPFDVKQPFLPAYSGNVFIGATHDFDEAQAVIYGMPMDWTVSFRSGARLGPARIREVSLGLEEYSPYLDRDLSDIRYFDAGDVPLPFGNPQASIERIYAYVKALYEADKLPIGLGGEHLVSWGAIQAAIERYPDLRVIHIDAHTDLRDHYEGEPFSHATVIKKVCDAIGPDRVYQFGIRSGTREEFAWARENTHFAPFELAAPLRSVLPELHGKPVYVTWDIDVFDPATAPGTGTAEHGGIFAPEGFRAIQYMKSLNVVGFDLVEVAPQIDPTEQTQILAAKLIREALLAFVP